MNYLATLPPKTRFYAALVCLPLLYLVLQGVGNGLPWAAKQGLPAVLLVGSLGVVATAKCQHIAAAIVRMFYRE